MAEEQVQIEHLPRKTGVSPLGERYLEILIAEYKGRVPHGQKKKIAERLQCSPASLSQFDRGYYPAWTAERDKRLKELAPFIDPLNHVIELQRLYEQTLDYRKKRGLPLSGKDPVDILAEMRKAIQGNGPTVLQAENVDARTTVFNFEGLDDEALSNAIEQITQRLRDGGLDDLGDVIEGHFENLGGADPAADTRSGTPRLTDGESAKSGNEVQGSAQDAG